MIQDAAAKCRYCGEWLDPSKRPDWAQPAADAASAPPAEAKAEAVAEPASEAAPALERPQPGRDVDPASTTTDGSVHRPRRRGTQVWSAPAWMAREDEPKAAKPAAAPVEPEPPLATPPAAEAPAAAPIDSAELLATPAPAAAPVEHTIDEVAERMKRIKASAAAVREAMQRESASLQPEVLEDEFDDAAETMHAGSVPEAAAPALEEPTPQPPPDVAAMMGDDFDDFDDDDDDDNLDDDLGPPAKSAAKKGPGKRARQTDDFDDLDDEPDDDALPTGGALAGFSFDDDDDDDFDDDDDEFGDDFGDVGAGRPIPWKPVAIGAALAVALGVGVFWDRIFPSETLEEAPAGEEANNAEEGDEAPAADGQVAQGSVAPSPAPTGAPAAPPPGEGQPVVPEGQAPAAVGTPVANPADPNAPAVDPAAPADPNAPAVDPAAADPNAAAPPPAAPPAGAPSAPLAGDALAVLDEARGLYQKGGKKRLGQAKEKLQGILDAQPNSADALLLMAQVQLELGETEASLATATKCTTVAPQTADCWLSIGVLKQNAKDKPAAASAYERYLALAPEGAYASQVKKQLARLQ